MACAFGEEERQDRWGLGGIRWDFQGSGAVPGAPRVTPTTQGIVGGAPELCC